MFRSPLEVAWCLVLDQHNPDRSVLARQMERVGDVGAVGYDKACKGVKAVIPLRPHPIASRDNARTQVP